MEEATWEDGEMWPLSPTKVATAAAMAATAAPPIPTPPSHFPTAASDVITVEILAALEREARQGLPHNFVEVM